MKYSIKISPIILSLFFALFFCSKNTNAQKADTYKILSEKVASKSFVFEASSLTPMSGRLRILNNGEYDVKIKADSIISTLPYFGNAQSMPSTTEEAGIMFTSTKFEYTSESGKKKTWEVTIKFKDQRNAQQFFFTIYDNGEAMLNVTSLLRDPISFRGSIKM